MPSYNYFDNTISTLRLPLHGWIDLTYRCNFQCRHCWLWQPADSPRKRDELSFEEISRFVDEARKMGCRQWSISGGEPMLRPDFEAIFDYLTRQCIFYSLNTNGSLITPSIARLLTRNGHKMVALYGADEKMHDHITRTPGSFEAFIRGCRYLKEAGAAFTVQIIPMRDNYSQLDRMFELAKSKSPNYRIGATWLNLSSDHREKRNNEIKRQRLSAREIIDIDPSRPGFHDPDIGVQHRAFENCSFGVDDQILWSCVYKRNEFHIDPYGTIGVCSALQDPSLRFDYRQQSFKHIWEKLIPSIAERVGSGEKHQQRCGACELKTDCSWCAAYGYLENADYHSPVPSLCDIARERKRFRKKWLRENRRFFHLAGMTILFDSDIALPEHAFDKRFIPFQADGPGDDMLYISHQIGIPDLSRLSDSSLVYNRSPWAIYRYGSSWIYKVIGSNNNHSQIYRVAVFSDDHNRAVIYHPDASLLVGSPIETLTATTSDLIMLSRVLSARKAFYIHAAGLIVNGCGLLFTGHSGAGKSTVVKLMRRHAQILCDDRVIVRRWPDGFHVHGTWSHGEIPEVANEHAPLKAVFFLEQASENSVTPILKKDIIPRLLLLTMKPFVTTDWWNNVLDTINIMVEEVPFYILRFNKDNDPFLSCVESVVGKFQARVSDGDHS